MSSYPSDMTLRPLHQWPREFTAHRRRAPFRVGWSETINLLNRELHMLGTCNRNAPSVLQIAMRDEDFRRDGLPRAAAVPEHPGVILNIDAAAQGPLSFPCDAFDRWTDNLRAIALALEALRKVDRYGITPGNEQYTGWKALPQNGSALTFTSESAKQFLASLVGAEGDGLDLRTLPQVYRRARAAAHPDRNGGDRAMWDKVERAAGALRAAGVLS